MDGWMRCAGSWRHRRVPSKQQQLASSGGSVGGPSKSLRNFFYIKLYNIESLFRSFRLPVLYFVFFLFLCFIPPHPHHFNATQSPPRCSCRRKHDPVRRSQTAVRPLRLQHQAPAAQVSPVQPQVQDQETPRRLRQRAFCRGRKLRQLLRGKTPNAPPPLGRWTRAKCKTGRSVTHIKTRECTHV